MKSLRIVLSEHWALYRLYQKHNMGDMTRVARLTLKRLIKVIRELEKQP